MTAYSLTGNSVLHISRHLTIINALYNFPKSISTELGIISSRSKSSHSYQLKEPHTVKIMNVHGHTKNVPVWLTLLTEKINVGAETA